ncbi:hypothetical protein DBR23_16225 [Acidovorax sp. HMWF018]|uniref:hypothetical protein n=1 Tax=Acidovorax sp. HMWF018 TaxID=2056855 RepID=UPI000D3B230D|nr:hypothetical protein [Acidovorax sp. HMWF018]PTT37839.1 hypothetical protein DBR23_16225 [Acidovorax sp. HMWF018]
MAQRVPSTSSASVFGGLWFVFQHADNRFALWISSLTGKEELYLNDALVAVRRKIALTSVHELTLNGSKYSLELSTKNMRRGIFECVLRENGHPVAALATEYVVPRRGLQSAIALIGTALVVYLSLKTHSSFGLAGLGILVWAALSFAIMGRGSGYAIRAIPPRESQKT